MCHAISDVNKDSNLKANDRIKDSRLKAKDQGPDSQGQDQGLSVCP